MIWKKFVSWDLCVYKGQINVQHVVDPSFKQFHRIEIEDQSKDFFSSFYKHWNFEMSLTFT